MRFANITGPQCVIVNGLSFWWEKTAHCGRMVDLTSASTMVTGTRIVCGPVFVWGDFHLHLLVRMVIPLRQRARRG